MAIYGYGLQIYCDFSGYTDIAIGVGLILGYRLPLNFNSPYKAAGLSDFWKRWHISLSRWLKDYLYISLGGNRKGKIRTAINLFITMVLGGLWHGASLRFIIWGALHGTGLLVSKIISGLRKRSDGLTRAEKFIAIFITFNFVSFTWIFFRASDMEMVKIMLSQIFTSFLPGSWSSLFTAYLQVFMLILAGYTIHFLPEKVKEAYRGLFIRTPIVLQFVITIMAAALILSMKGNDALPFIYFRF
jgi:D-alanyl-lipoteichoic acid acyltransferase DltB (MBOAT superfamily)